MPVPVQSCVPRRSFRALPLRRIPNNISCLGKVVFRKHGRVDQVAVLEPQEMVDGPWPASGAAGLKVLKSDGWT
jgi:hypothetical protein